MHRVLTAATSLALTAFVPGIVAAQPATERDFWWHPAFGWGQMMFGGLMMIVFWGGIILLIVLLVRWIGPASSDGREGTSRRSRPLEILQERFARGEIDKQEYEERRKILEQ